MMALSLALMTNTALAYNTFGHQTIAALADKYLTDKAKSEVNAILKSSMVQESVWLNTLRSQPEYAATKDWHISIVNPAKLAHSCYMSAWRKSASLLTIAHSNH